MKYIIIAYIAFGLVLSLIISVSYSCEGSEMFPEYYGSPFVFKRQSLGSSMTYYFSVSGILLNVAVWGIFVLLFHKFITYLIEKARKNKIPRFIYKVFIVVLITFSTFNIMMDYLMHGRGFEKGRNYWYMNMDKEAKAYGMDCKGEWSIF